MASPLALQIVSFDWPWPPTYGGVIDVYYRIDSLLAGGVAVDLHVVAGPTPAARMPAHWDTPLLRVFAYERRGWTSAIGRRPFIVASRDVARLLPSLAAGPPVILYEGIHTTATLAHPRLGSHAQWVRVHNVEADYYAQLAESASGWRRRYFREEARRLRSYEPRVLAQADLLLPISARDEGYCTDLAPERTLVHGPYASPEAVSSRLGRGEYVLFHAGLHVRDNEAAARTVADRVAALDGVELVVAGRSPSAGLRAYLASLPRVRLEPDPPVRRMHELIEQAQVVALHAHHAAGFKIKLVESLARGRFVLANGAMVAGAPGLRTGVDVYDEPRAWSAALKALMARPFTTTDLAQREKQLAGRLRGELVRALTERLADATFRTN